MRFFQHLTVFAFLLTTFVVLEQHSRLPEMHVLVFPWLLVLIPVTIGVIVVSKSRSLAITALCGVLLMTSSAMTHWTAKIRFHFSESAFNELHDRIANGERDKLHFPRRVGLYWVEAVYHSDTIGFVMGECLLDECGIYFNPDRPRSNHFLTTKIGNGWYLTEW